MAIERGPQTEYSNTELAQGRQIEFGWCARTRDGCSIGRDALNVPKGYPPLPSISSVSTRITGLPRSWHDVRNAWQRGGGRIKPVMAAFEGCAEITRMSRCHLLSIPIRSDLLSSAILSLCNPFFPLFYSMIRLEDSRITLDLRFSDFRIGFCSLMEGEFLKNFAGNIVVLFFERERQSDSRIIRLFLFEEKFLENLPSFRIQMKVNQASLR